MTLIAVYSLKGSPGATTTALGLAARWPSGAQTVLLECDPAGGDLLARFRLETSPGLVSLAAAVRRSADPQVLWQHVQRLPGGLPVVIAPPSAEQADAALGEIAANVTAIQQAADEPDTVVVVDCGRIGADPSTAEVLKRADVTVLVARPMDDSLAHVATRLARLARWSSRSCFVLIGNGYSTAEVAATLATPVTARLPHDPKGAAALGGEHSKRNALRRSPLGSALADLAASLAKQSGEQPLHHVEVDAPAPRVKAVPEEILRGVASSSNGAGR